MASKSEPFYRATAYAVGFIATIALITVSIIAISPYLMFTAETLLFAATYGGGFAVAVWLLVYFVRKVRPVQKPGKTGLIVTTSISIIALAVMWVYLANAGGSGWFDPFISTLLWVGSALPAIVAIALTSFGMNVLETFFPPSARGVRDARGETDRSTRTRAQNSRRELL